MNSYDDDPPPYPGLAITANIRPTATYFLPKRSSRNSTNFNHNIQRCIQTQQWRLPYNQYRICYIGDLPDDFLRINVSFKYEMNNTKSITEIQPDQSRRFSTRFPSVKILKTSKIRARMLENVLKQIEQGQTMKISMVPEEPITHSDSYSYGII